MRRLCACWPDRASSQPANLRPYNATEARAVLEIAHRWQRKMLESRGTRFVFPSDEFYLLAGHPLPPEEAYEGFPMLENGVGMVRDFLSEGLPSLPKAVPYNPRDYRHGNVVRAGARVGARAVAGVRGLDIEVRVIPNVSFGEPTTVAGLLTGRCFLDGVQPAEADLLMVSPSTLRYGTETMLDEITLTDFVPTPENGRAGWW